MNAPRMVTCVNASDGEDEYLVEPEPGAVCRHEYCLFVDGIRRSFATQRASAYSAADIEEMRADRELMRDEFHGRDVQP